MVVMHSVNPSNVYFTAGKIPLIQIMFISQHVMEDLRPIVMEIEPTYEIKNQKELP